MTYRSKKTRAGFVACAATSLLSLAISQHALAQGDEMQEEVIVYGIREALSTALDTKRDSTAIVDSINASDIGTLPDNNVAEALQRIPGIQVTRDSTGEGNGFQIRGINENRIELDGRTILPDGANGRNGSTRNIPATIVSSLEAYKSQSADLTEGSLGGSIVVKTRKPIETGFLLSGLLGAAKDSDVDETDTKYSFLASNAWDMGDTTVGALINVSYEDYHESGHNITVANWRSAPTNFYCGGGSNNPAICPDGAGPLYNTSSHHVVPQLFRIQRPFDVRERTGIDTVFEIAPSDNLDIALHLNYNSFDNFGSNQRTVVPIRQEGFVRFRHDENFLNIKTISRDPFPGELNADGTQKTDQVTRSFILQGIADNSRPRYASNVGKNESEQWNNALSVHWEPSEKWVIDAQLSMAESENRSRAFNFQLSTLDTNNATLGNKDPDGLLTDFPSNHPSIFWDFRSGGENIVLRQVMKDDILAAPLEFTRADGTMGTVSNAEYTDLSNSKALGFQNFNGNYDVEGPGEIIAEDAFKIDVDWNVDAGILSTVEAGFRFSDRSAYNRTIRYEGNTQNVQYPFALLPENIQDFFYYEPDPVAPDAKGEFNKQWWTPRRPVDFNRAEAIFRQLETEVLPEGRIKTSREETFNSFYDISEETTAFYAKLNFEGEIGSVPFRGDVGIRHVSTDINSVGKDPDAPDQIPLLDPEFNAKRQTITLTDSYSKSLPSMTFSFDFMENLIGRIHYSHRMARPNLGDISPALSLQGAQATGTAGNPGLAPKESQNFDMSLEWYFQEDAVLSAAVFDIGLDSFYDTDTISGVIIPGQVDNTGAPILFDITTKVNGPSGSTQGFELSYQQLFAYGFGAQLNYTFADSKQPDTFRDDITGKVLPLTQTSENSYNIVLFWENYGFETRLAYNWRDERYVGGGAPEKDPVTFEADADGNISTLDFTLPKYREPYGQIDFSIGYKFLEDYSIRLQGRNITKNHQREYIGIEEALNQLAYTGSRWEMVFSAKLK